MPRVYGRNLSVRGGAMKINVKYYPFGEIIEVKKANVGYQEMRLPYPRGYFKNNGYLKKRIVVDGEYFDFTVRKLTKDEL